MGSQYIPPPEQNVVNVGDEISINALNGIAQANPAITSTNPVATDTSVATAVSGKANLSGATFTGKLNLTTASGLPSINVGTVSSIPSSTSNGDIWIGSALNFKDNAGNSRTCVVTNTANTIAGSTTSSPLLTVTQNSTMGSVGALTVNNASLGTGVIIANTNASSTAPAIRVTNTGGGHSFLVEDEANDNSAFVISNTGKVGIGIAPHATSCLKLDNTGLMFGDGSTVTSVSNAIGQMINHLFSGATIYNSAVTLTASYTWTNPDNNSYSGTVTTGSDTASIYWNGSTASFVQTLSGSPTYTNGTLEGPITDPDNYQYVVIGNGDGTVYATAWI